MKVKTLIVAIVVLGFMATVQAQVPRLINYQGVLTHPTTGAPLSGSYSIQFAIYNVAAGGTALWSETQSVTVTDGLFNVLLGTIALIPYPVFDGSDRYLGVKVGTDPEMTPRKQLVSVGYAFRAFEADKLDGQDASSFSPATHDHNALYYTKSELNTNDGTVNQPADPVSWFKIKDMPAGFADGTDDVGAAGGITQINVGPGMTVTNPTGPTTTLGLSMGHGNGINADLVDSKHASDFAIATHNHLGQAWDWGTNTGNGLVLTGAVPWSNGLFRVNNSQNGPSIWGMNTGGGNAVRGDGYGTSIGVYGEGASGPGVVGRSASEDGVQGFASASNKSGVFALNSGAGYGVVGRSINGWGMEASGNDASNADRVGDLVLGGNIGEIFCFGHLGMYVDHDAYIDLDDDNNDANAKFVIFDGTDAFRLTVDEGGNLWASGTKSAVVQTANHGQRLLYAMESPGVWFEDFGQASLVNGEVTVAFDPIFAETVNLEADYHVFVTPLCQEPVLLFVTARNAKGFTVRGVTLNGQPSGGTFDYRVVAKRLGYEKARLEETTWQKKANND